MSSKTNHQQRRKGDAAQLTSTFKVPWCRSDLAGVSSSAPPFDWRGASLLFRAGMLEYKCRAKRADEGNVGGRTGSWYL